MNGRTSKLLRRAARAAEVNERALVRRWRKLTARERGGWFKGRGGERNLLARVVARAEAKGADSLPAQVAGIVGAERRKRAESRIILPPKRLVTP